MVQSGPKWFTMVKNGEKWSKSPKMVKIAKNGQNGLKWSKMVQMVENGQKWSKNGQNRGTGTFSKFFRFVGFIDF